MQLKWKSPERLLQNEAPLISSDQILPFSVRHNRVTHGPANSESYNYGLIKERAVGKMLSKVLEKSQVVLFREICFFAPFKREDAAKKLIFGWF